MTIGWFFVVAAGFFEAFWVILMKMFAQKNNSILAVIMVICMIGSFSTLLISMRYLPLGIAYAVWTGIGVTGATIAGLLLFRESYSSYIYIFIAMILVGVVGVLVLSNRK